MPSKNRAEVFFLCECSTRVIADVVTAKLDVCEAAVLLPTEPETSERSMKLPRWATQTKRPKSWKNQ